MVCVYGWLPVLISCWVDPRYFWSVFFLNNKTTSEVCAGFLVIKTSFAAFDMFLLCSLENWNQHFLEVRAVSLGSNKCIFDEFRVFWDTFVALFEFRWFLWFNPSTASKRCHRTSDLQRCGKNPKETSSTSHILQQIRAIPVRISGWTDSICIQLEPLWFIMMFCVFFVDLVRDSNWNMVQVMRQVNPPSHGFNGSTVKNPPPWWW